jgi:hypothetical protein
VMTVTNKQARIATRLSREPIAVNLLKPGGNSHRW